MKITKNIEIQSNRCSIMLFSLNLRFKGFETQSFVDKQESELSGKICREDMKPCFFVGQITVWKIFFAGWAFTVTSMFHTVFNL